MEFTQINNGDKYYDENFYKNQIEGSYKSAKIYVAYFSSVFKFRRVVDVGCVRGMCLKAFKENTAELNLILNEAGFHPIKNIAFMDCVHPDLYRHQILQSSVKNILIQMCKKVIPKSLISFFRKIKFTGQ
jgi:hypothetical protein